MEPAELADCDLPVFVTTSQQLYMLVCKRGI